jgi:AraC family transcriptional regulator
MTTATPRKPATAQDYHERILRALLYIQSHLDDDLRLEDVASAAAFSPYHFHRIFRGLVGETLGEHTRRLRLERAAGRLKHAGEPVTQIAFEAGFESHEAFTRAFGQRFNMSPSKFRNDASNYHLPDNGDLPPIEVKDLAPQRIVYLRHTGPYAAVGATWQRLMMWAGRKGLLGPDIKMIGLSYDDPDVTPPDKLRYEAAVVVTCPVEPEGEFGVQDLPGGKYAIATHRGPYETLSETYEKLFGMWLPQSGHHLRDTPTFEQYLNSPQSAKPEDLLTLIHLPLES